LGGERQEEKELRVSETRAPVKHRRINTEERTERFSSTGFQCKEAEWKGGGKLDNAGISGLPRYDVPGLTQPREKEEEDRAARAESIHLNLDTCSCGWGVLKRLRTARGALEGPRKGILKREKEAMSVLDADVVLGKLTLVKVVNSGRKGAGEEEYCS